MTTASMEIRRSGSARGGASESVPTAIAGRRDGQARHLHLPSSVFRASTRMAPGEPDVARFERLIRFLSAAFTLLPLW
jgi:hypothetical protein